MNINKFSLCILALSLGCTQLVLASTNAESKIVLPQNIQVSAGGPDAFVNVLSPTSFPGGLSVDHAKVIYGHVNQSHILHLDSVFFSINSDDRSVQYTIEPYQVQVNVSFKNKWKPFEAGANNHWKHVAKDTWFCTKGSVPAQCPIIITG